MLCALTCAPLQAQELQPLPTYGPVAPEVLAKHFKDVNATFEHNSALNFTVHIPQNFRIVPKDRLRALEDVPRFYGELFEAHGPAIELGLRPYFKVLSIRPERTITPEKWFQIQVREKGYVPVGMSVISHHEVDVLYERLDDRGYAEIVRARIFHHQNRLVMVEYVLPARLRDAMMNSQTVSIASFNFTDDIEIDAQEQTGLFRIEGMQMRYPRSWRFQTQETEAINRHEFSLEAIDADQFVFATVNGALIASKSLRDRLDRTLYPVNLMQDLVQARQSVEQMGFDLGDALEAHAYQQKFKTDFSVVEVYPMRRRTNSVFVVEDQTPVSHELWLAVIRTPRAVGKNYIFTMITPARQANYAQWAYAVDGFRSIVESIE